MLNAERVRLRGVLAVAQGAALANSSDPIDPAVFDAVASDDDEADRLAARANLQRLKRATLNRHGMGG